MQSTELNYRRFILKVLESEPRLNQAKLAARAQIKSRSFVTDLLKGSKRITPKTLPRFVEALKLKGAQKQLFEFLVMREERDCRPPRLTEEKILESIAKYSQSSEKTRAEILSKKEVVFSSKDVFTVYAALGVPGVGATILEIKQRTMLAESSIKLVLDHLVRHGLLEKIGEKYSVTEANIDLSGLGITFKKSYLESLSEILQRANAMEAGRGDLFYRAALSIDGKRVPELRSRIRELIQEFVNQEQSLEGDQVWKINLAFYR